MSEYTDEVAHGAAGHKERGLLAGERGNALLQPQNGRVVTEHVVTHLGTEELYWGTEELYWGCCFFL